LAGKAWCCGGGSGGSGGLTSITTTGTPTVDLEGDGSAGAPLSAAVILAPAPNGLQEATGGLLVAPSADAGNTLTVGGDGRLFVPAPTPTTVIGQPGSSPAVPSGGSTVVGTERSVDVDAVQSPAGTWTVGARLSPVWAQTGEGGIPDPGNGAWSPGASLIIPERGVYFFEAYVFAQLNDTPARTSDNRVIWAGLGIDGAIVKQAVATNNTWAFPDAGTFASQGAATITLRAVLNAGQVISVNALYGGIPPQVGDGHGASGAIGFHKISD
jgi:hypothetical protein